MNKMVFRNKKFWLMTSLFFASVIFLLNGGIGTAMQGDEKTKKTEHYNAYKIYQKNCLGCHVSVADPERPGRDRDDWFVVINLMHDYGVNLTSEESRIITDFLFDLRKGPAPHY